MSPCVVIINLTLALIDSFIISSQVVVAETVIVGNVPNTYLDTGGLYGTISKNSGIN